MLLIIDYAIIQVTDLAGSLNFSLLAILGFVWQATWYPRQAVLSGLVVVWGVRLGVFLLVRVLLRGKDARFDGIREDTLKFAGFWLFQVIWVWVVSLPVTFTNGSTQPGNPLGAVDYVGWSLWVFGWLFESIADQQRFNFNNQRRRGAAAGANSAPNSFLKSGLWSICRHPNYFGEIVLWLGIWISSSFGLWPVSVPAAILGLLSPLLTATLLLGVSGMPIGEKREAQKWGHLAAYRTYIARTSPVWPFPPPLYARLPWWLKASVFMDRKYIDEQQPQLNQQQSNQPQSNQTTRKRSK